MPHLDMSKSEVRVEPGERRFQLDDLPLRQASLSWLIVPLKRARCCRVRAAAIGASRPIWMSGSITPPFPKHEVCKQEAARGEVEAQHEERQGEKIVYTFAAYHSLYVLHEHCNLEGIRQDEGEERERRCIHLADRGGVAGQPYFFAMASFAREDERFLQTGPRRQMVRRSEQGVSKIRSDKEGVFGRKIRCQTWRSPNNNSEWKSGRGGSTHRASHSGRERIRRPEPGCTPRPGAVRSRNQDTPVHVRINGNACRNIMRRRSRLSCALLFACMCRRVWVFYVRA